MEEGDSKKVWVSLVTTLPLSNVIFLSVYVVCVCVCVCVYVCVCVCVLFIYTISISIISVSQEEPSLIASNQQIHDFYKQIIFEKKKHCGK